LYTKTFEFNEQYELKTLTFQHLADYSDMIQKFVQKNTVQPVPIQTVPMQTTPTPVSVPTPFPSSNYIGFQNPFSQYQFNKR
jgi:hypothetical protein